VELLQRKNTSIKKLRELIFGKRTERHQTRKAEGHQKAGESEKAEDCRPLSAGDQDARAELCAIESGEKAKRKGHGRRAASDYSGANGIWCAGASRNATQFLRRDGGAGRRKKTSRAL
jgi:hypothetical protein